MRMNVFLHFHGNCAEAFAFYAKVFQAGAPFHMPYSASPVPMPMPLPPDWQDKVMHTSVPIGEAQLMGCDAPPGTASPVGGFRVCVESRDEAEVRRLFDALRQGGSVQMPLAPTFWSPLFGMCTDSFGVGWMISQEGTPPSA